LRKLRLGRADYDGLNASRISDASFTDPSRASRLL
jgi:hypothetical protein